MENIGTAYLIIASVCGAAAFIAYVYGQNNLKLLLGGATCTFIGAWYLVAFGYFSLIVAFLLSILALLIVVLLRALSAPEKNEEVLKSVSRLIEKFRTHSLEQRSIKLHDQIEMPPDSNADRIRERIDTLEKELEKRKHSWLRTVSAIASYVFLFLIIGIPYAPSILLLAVLGFLIRPH